MSKINIAIDGHAGCGKSTTARRVAEQLGYLYIDTGAMYRAVTLYLLRNDIPFEEESEALGKALEQIEIDFEEVKGKAHREITLNGERVEAAIRSPEVSAAVSQVSVHPVVRRAMVKQQQRMALRKGVVMDGRDIGTVVLPDAELKVFMTADMEVRAARRRKEMQEKGRAQKLEEVVKNLEDRDRIDSSRKEGPLKQAAGAVVIDTTHLTIEDQVAEVLRLAKEHIESTIEVQS